MKFDVETVIAAYCQGVFPMADSRTGELAWYQADPRAILPLEGFHVPRSLGKRYRSGRFRITLDQAFPAVMAGCAAPRPGHPETWINDEILDVYCQLHGHGLAHSVEAWLPEGEAAERYLSPAGADGRGADGVADGGTHGGAERDGDGRGSDCSAGLVADDEAFLVKADGWRLVGGLYGVSLGGAFFGESMFSRAADASKVCLVRLVEHLRQREFALLDVQFHNDHLAKFGIVEMAHRDYLPVLEAAIEMDVMW